MKAGLNSRVADVVVLLLLPFGGACSYVLGGLFAPEYYNSVLLPALRTGVEGFNIVTVVCLVMLGAMAGIASRIPAVVIGPTALAFMPLWSVAEMRLDPTSHNLWPLEWMIYGLTSLLPAAGAWMGRWIRSRRNGGQKEAV